MAWLHAPPFQAKDLTLSLRERRELLAECLQHLLTKAWQLGLTATLGEVTRDARVAELNAAERTGIKNSLHLDGLAVDLNIYRDGQWLQTTEDHRLLGAFWERLHPLCRWGGHFQDGNHYSITFGGRK